MRTATATRRVSIPIQGGEILLQVPQDLSDQALNREIASQDLIRKKFLATIERLERLAGSNRELLFCSLEKLRTISQEFLGIHHDIARFIADFANYRSVISPLHEAREDVRLFFVGHIKSEIEEIDILQHALFDGRLYRDREPPKALGSFRRKLAKGTGLLRTELQKMFAHLFASDPRNLYRHQGARDQTEILFRQFRHDVAVTAQLYSAIRKLDTYMRGAIMPSDVIKMIAERIAKDKHLGCLFEPDYNLFLNALIDEVLDILLPELREVLNLEGVWYDDFENIERKSKMLSEACIAFRALYNERSGLREQVLGMSDQAAAPPLSDAIAVFDTYKFQEVATSLQEIDQILIDLEGSLLQWEQGIARRAFADPSWQRAEPLQRRAAR